MKIFILLLFIFQILFFSQRTTAAEYLKNIDSLRVKRIINHYLNDNSGFSTEKTLALFGNKKNNSVVVIDVEKMQHLFEIFTNHEITYTADRVGKLFKVYAVNRGSNAIDILDTQSMKITKSIALKHTPRSAEAINKALKLCAVSGMDKPMVSIISAEQDKVIAVVGDNTVTQPVNNHGSHASGHPFWLDDQHFVLIDRKKHKIFTYELKQNSQGRWKAILLNSVDTVTSAHQIIPRKGRYFGSQDKYYLTVEGSDAHYPMIMELQFVPDIGLVKTRELEVYKKGVSPLDSHIHHGDFHPNEKLIYVGSKEGNFFIVNYETMQIVKSFKAGKGAGHTFMIPQKNRAIIINHSDTFVTVVNTMTNDKVGDVQVSFLPKSMVGQKTIQAHPKYHASKDGKFFYAFLTEEGAFYQLDLDKLQVINTINIDGKPAQGSFIRLGK